MGSGPELFSFWRVSGISSKQPFFRKSLTRTYPGRPPKGQEDEARLNYGRIASEGSTGTAARLCTDAQREREREECFEFNRFGMTMIWFDRPCTAFCLHSISLACRWSQNVPEWRWSPWPTDRIILSCSPHTHTQKEKRWWCRVLPDPSMPQTTM